MWKLPTPGRSEAGRCSLRAAHLEIGQRAQRACVPPGKGGGHHGPVAALADRLVAARRDSNVDEGGGRDEIVARLGLRGGYLAPTFKVRTRPGARQPRRRARGGVGFFRRLLGPSGKGCARVRSLQVVVRQFVV